MQNVESAPQAGRETPPRFDFADDVRPAPVRRPLEVHNAEARAILERNKAKRESQCFSCGAAHEVPTREMCPTCQALAEGHVFDEGAGEWQ